MTTSILRFTGEAVIERVVRGVGGGIGFCRVGNTLVLDVLGGGGTSTLSFACPRVVVIFAGCDTLSGVLTTEWPLEVRGLTNRDVFGLGVGEVIPPSDDSPSEDSIEIDFDVVLFVDFDSAGVGFASGAPVESSSESMSDFGTSLSDSPGSE